MSTEKDKTKFIAWDEALERVMDRSNIQFDSELEKAGMDMETWEKTYREPAMAERKAAVILVTDQL